MNTCAILKRRRKRLKYVYASGPFVQSAGWTNYKLLSHLRSWRPVQTVDQMNLDVTCGVCIDAVLCMHVHVDVCRQCIGHRKTWLNAVCMCTLEFAECQQRVMVTTCS